MEIWGDTDMQGSKWLAVAGVLGSAAVLLGAFGAHGLPKWLAEQGRDVATIAIRVDNYETAVRYHFYHTLAIGMLGMLDRDRDRKARGINWAGGMWLAGIMLFSGSLYVLVFTEIRALGMVVPLGGVLLAMAWLVLPVVIVPSLGASATRSPYDQ